VTDALELLRRMNSQNHKPRRDDDGTDKPPVAVPNNDPLLAALRREHPERGYNKNSRRSQSHPAWRAANQLFHRAIASPLNSSRFGYRDCLSVL
jgi:hypothetical protein